MTKKVKINLPSKLYYGYYYNVQEPVELGEGDRDQIVGYTLSSDKFGYLTSYRTPCYRKGQRDTNQNGDLCFYVSGRKEGSLTFTVYLVDGSSYSKKVKVVAYKVPKDVKTVDMLIDKFGWTSNRGYAFNPKDYFWWKKQRGSAPPIPPRK